MIGRLAVGVAASTLAAAVPLPMPQTIALGGQPTTMTVGPGAIWVANYGGWTIDRVDPAHPAVVRRIRMSGQPYGVAVGGGSVWASSWSTRFVSRIDPRRGRVVVRIDVGSAQQAGILATPNAVWVAVFGSGTVVRIDPRRNAITARIHVGGKPESVALFAGSLWVPNEDGTLARIDPATNRVLRRIPVGPDPDDVQPCGGLVWTSSLHGPSLAAVDPGSNVVLRRVRVGVGSKGLACGRDLWTANYDTGEVIRISLDARRVTARASVGSGPRAVVLTPGSVWVANQLSGTLSRFAIAG